jgi:HPt (histidine-containing phosphotransfer) domain-containing protein
MDDFLSKPIDPSVLLNVIQRWLIQDDSPPETANSIVSNTPEPKELMSDNSSKHVELMFDHDDLLRRMDNDDDIIVLIVEAFLEDIPARIDAIESALTSTDFNQLIREAHSIKGTAANIGAKALSQYALELEQAAKLEDNDVSQQTFETLKECFAELKIILEKF